MAWAKAITEISLEIDYNNEDEYIEITLEKIAKKVLKYYWEQTIYFNLVQGSNPNKPSKIVTTLNQDVSYRFLNLLDGAIEDVYQYIKVMIG